MGMRAVVAYRREDANGEELTTITTVQFAQHALDRYPQALYNLMHMKDLSFEEAARYLFSAITRHDHIGSLNVVRLDIPEEGESRAARLKQAVKDSNFLGVPMRDVDTGKLWDFVVSAERTRHRPQVDTTGDPLADIVAKHGYAEDGISVYYDEVGEPDKVWFYRAAKYNESGNDMREYIDGTFSDFTPYDDLELLV